MRWRDWSNRVALAAALALAIQFAYGAGPCDTLTPCAARACRLDAQIARSKAKGDSRELAALERQRAEMTHCSDEGLKQKRKVALQQAQRRIDQREAELKKAEAAGDAARIKKAQSKVEGARKAYAEMENSPL